MSIILSIDPGENPLLILSPRFSGEKGTGVLSFRCGYGEYLDPIAILKAKNVMKPNEPDAKLGIEELVLAGFVVDSQALQKCFNLKKLRRIEFAHDCVDAGFSIPTKERGHIEVVVPNSASKPQPTLTSAVKPGEIQLVTLKGGKVIHREPAFPAVKGDQHQHDHQHGHQHGQQHDHEHYSQNQPEDGDERLDEHVEDEKEQPVTGPSSRAQD